MLLKVEQNALLFKYICEIKYLSICEITIIKLNRFSDEASSNQFGVRDIFINPLAYIKISRIPGMA